MKTLLFCDESIYALLISHDLVRLLHFLGFISCLNVLQSLGFFNYCWSLAARLTSCSMNLIIIVSHHYICVLLSYCWPLNAFGNLMFLLCFNLDLNVDLVREALFLEGYVNFLYQFRLRECPLSSNCFILLTCGQLNFLFSYDRLLHWQITFFNSK